MKNLFLFQNGVEVVCGLSASEHIMEVVLSSAKLEHEVNKTPFPNFVKVSSKTCFARPQVRLLLLLFPFIALSKTHLCYFIAETNVDL